MDTKRRLPQLRNVRVASPCSESWDDMEGDERVRLCLTCEKNVYDLSSLTEEEARTLIADTEGKVCVRFYRRRDGTILTADCPVGQARSLGTKIAAAALALGVGALALAVAPATPAPCDVPAAKTHGGKPPAPTSTPHETRPTTSWWRSLFEPEPELVMGEAMPVVEPEPSGSDRVPTL